MNKRNHTYSDKKTSANPPKISIVTPSYNQGKFIEETILSVLNQNYPNLEYIIIDGGSTDESVDIIRKYEEQIDFWVSEQDNGQSDAINKGFEKATGLIGNWICSDDLLCENALINFVNNTKDFKSKIFLGNGYRINEKGEETKKIVASSIDSLYKLLDIKNNWRSKNRDSILQQSVFFPIDSFRAVGGLSESKHFTMDFELWGKLMNLGLDIQKSEIDIGKFRWYDGQKTSYEHEVTKELINTAHDLISISNSLTVSQKAELEKKLKEYTWSYNYSYIRSSIGIKRRIKAIFKL